MASATDPILARLVAVVCGGRGADGFVDGTTAISAHGRDCAIPVGRFRKGLRGAPLRDPGYPRAALDRATRWTWLDDTDEVDPGNDVDPTSLQLLRLRLEVAYLFGKGVEHLVKLAGGTGEVAANAVLNPQARALNDALRIRRALGWHELVQGAVDPAIYDVHREGPTTLDESAGPGLLVSQTTYVVRVELSNAAAYDW